jgi:hypothetical protein
LQRFSTVKDLTVGEASSAYNASRESDIVETSLEGEKRHAIPSK